MSIWPFTKLGSIAEFKNGLNYSHENWGRGVKVIGVADFQDYLYPRYETLGEIDPRGVVRDQDYLEDGDILFVRSNGNPALIGRSLVIKEPPERVSHSGFTIRLRFTSDQVFLPFYVYLFRSSLIRSTLSVFGGGTNISNLNQEILRRLSVPVPSLPTQRKIATVLGAYDDLIEANRRRIVLLEKMAEELYREWFVRLRFPGHAKTKITKGLPAGWSLVQLANAFDFTGGGTPSKEVSRYWQDGTINWFTPSDITAASGIFLDQSSDRCTEEGFAESSAKMFPAYSVMMTSRATIGAIGINLTPACTNQGFITCVPNERYPLPYLFHWLKLGKTHFELLSGGSTFAELTKGTFKKMAILTPPQALMDSFAERERPMFQTIEILQRQNANLTRTRDLLLPRLISGKLAVDTLDIAFPPSLAAGR